MLEWMLFRAVMVALFILANSFFVAAEFALISVRETRMEQLLAQGRPGAQTALKLKHSIDEFLPAVQFGVTLASLALGWLGEPAVAEMLLNLAGRWMAVMPAHAVLYAHALAIAIAFGLITYFEVLLGELVPKSLALQRAERIAMAVAGPMDVFIRMTRPAVRLMNHSAALVLRLFRAPLTGEGSVHSPEELKLIASATRRMGLLPVFQEQIIHRAIELNHVTVREIMTPRGKIFSLPADMPIERASARIVEEQHSRIPVYEVRADAGAGMVGGPGPDCGSGVFQGHLAADAPARGDAGAGRCGGLRADAAPGDARCVCGSGDEAGGGVAAGVSGAAAADCGGGG
jgi:putative hemolysin